METAVGTSLLIITINSFAGYLGKAEMQWGLMALFTALAVAGSFAGTYLARLVPSGALQKAFAVFLVGMASLSFMKIGERFYEPKPRKRSSQREPMRKSFSDCRRRPGARREGYQ